MDRDRALFVFGEIPEVWDIDDPAERQALLASEVDDEGDDVDGDDGAGPMPGLMRATVLEQVASGRPAAVWATAQRLLAGGQHREQVIAGLVMAFAAAIQESFESGEDGFDESRYDAFLDTLPLPTQDDVIAAIIGALRGTPVPPTIEALAAAAIILLGCHDDRLATGRAAATARRGSRPGRMSRSSSAGPRWRCPTPSSPPPSSTGATTGWARAGGTRCTPSTTTTRSSGPNSPSTGSGS